MEGACPTAPYSGERNWTAPTDIGDLIDVGPGVPFGYRPTLGYLLVQVRSLRPGSLTSDNVLGMIAKLERAPTAEALE